MLTGKVHSRSVGNRSGLVCPYPAGVAALGTGTVTEVAVLSGAAWRLVRERGWLLVTWFCLGWAVHQLGLFGSALLGVEHAVAANTLFVVAIVAKLVSLVLMVQAVSPRLRLPGRASADPATTAAYSPVPAALFAPERTIDVLLLAVGPFLAVYAVWGFIDDEVSALFRSNYVLLGLGDVQRWSISLSNERLPFYLGLAAAGWLLRGLVRLIQRRRASPVVGVLGVVAEGVWALSTFVVLLIVARAVRDWVRGRLVWADLTALGHAAIAALPDFTLPLGAPLRQLARELVTVAPGAIATVLGLPLMWLALAAIVYGWRDYRAADVVAGTRVAGRLDRLSRFQRTPTGRVLLFVTGDLRTKYLPVAQALRLVARAGPRFVGAYLLLATVVTALQNLLAIGLSLLVGARSQPVALLLDPAQDLLVALPVTVISVGLYAAAFERAVSDVVLRASTPDAVLRAATPAPARGRRPEAEPAPRRPGRPG